MKLPANASPPEPHDAGSADLTPAVAVALGAGGADIDLTTPAVVVATVELRRLVAAWRRHEPGARLGEDPEELHQLRVTARRIDATLALFKRQLPAALVRARKATKAVLRSLGAARDLDVQLSELGQYCATLDSERRAAAEPLQALLEKERARARARMVRSLDAEPTRRWLETLSQATGTEPPRANGADPAMVVMPERVQRRFRKLRKSVRQLRPKSSMEDYHLVRRRAKQLRYATECGAPMFGRPAEEMLKALRRLQDKLGAHQDACMAQSRLAAIAADAGSGLPPTTLFLMGRLAEHYGHVTGDTRRTLARSWRKVRGKRWKALRARLAELRDSAEVAHAVFAPREPASSADQTSAEANFAGQPPETEPRALKH
ncbi:MAG TPA: CHAD domain-containing protein [Steroidobacteraceae bacterium]|jgi:CHAD domain-containing protein|nr:CHAD domain-containing protein [Steroidobacteraceae bacterium]